MFRMEKQKHDPCLEWKNKGERLTLINAKLKMVVQQANEMMHNFSQASMLTYQKNLVKWSWNTRK